MNDVDRLGDDEGAVPDRPRSAGVRAALTKGAALIAVVALVAGVLVLGVRLGAAEPPSDDSAEAGFLRDMQVHHSQAVEMAMLVRDRTDDDEVRRLSYDIALGQQQQVGQMYALLESWGLSQVPADGPMAWMSGASHGEDGADESAGAEGGHDMEEMLDESAAASDRLMPGMASVEEVQELRGSVGAAAERRFLTLMVRHHQAGVQMARAALEVVEEPQVRQLATSMVQGQSAEIDLMRSLLSRR